MEEIILENRKNGLAVLVAVLLGEVAAVLACILGGVLLEGWHTPRLLGGILLALGLLWLLLGWILLCGLKVLKPQEALVLTLFGKYVGTLKGEGFYFVNPFCVGVNPAAKTQLGQSGDVDSGRKS